MENPLERFGRISPSDAYSWSICDIPNPHYWSTGSMKSLCWGEKCLGGHYVYMDGKISRTQEYFYLDLV